MPIELHRLKLQLAILQVIIEDAIKNGKPFSEQTKIKRHTAWGFFCFWAMDLTRLTDQQLRRELRFAMQKQ